jgi:hypothetical protein
MPDESIKPLKTCDQDGDDGENPFRSPAAAPRPLGEWQFSLRGLLGVMAFVAALFGILAALGIDAPNTLIALASTLISAGIAVALVNVFWELTGGPRIRH